MIHYHGTPFSGESTKMVSSLSRRHAMVSYASPACLPIVAEVCQSFTIDNGAFSTWKSGKKYDIEGFAEWVTEWYKHPAFDWYVMPDVIDGTTYDNTAMLGHWRNLVPGDVWRRGVPVWHLHESLEQLQYLGLAHNRVALGSSGEFATVGDSKWWGRMTEAMNAICDEQGRPECRLHGLRMLDPTIFSHLPLSSADSTNVARNIGIDSRWRGTYSPKSQEVRAQVMMERIEHHASAAKWCNTRGVKRNMELFG